MLTMTDILSLLTAERDKLNRAIEALQGTARRPGRPARTSNTEAAKPPRKKRGMSRAARLAQSKRMKSYWAARRRQKS
jgi:hypothetical protein